MNGTDKATVTGHINVSHSMTRTHALYYYHRLVLFALFFVEYSDTIIYFRIIGTVQCQWLLVNLVDKWQRFCSGIFVQFKRNRCKLKDEPLQEVATVYRTRSYLGKQAAVNSVSFQGHDARSFECTEAMRGEKYCHRPISPYTTTEFGVKPEVWRSAYRIKLVARFKRATKCEFLRRATAFLVRVDLFRAFRLFWNFTFRVPLEL